jgi:hypothetical protein
MNDEQLGEGKRERKRERQRRKEKALCAVDEEKCENVVYFCVDEQICVFFM